MATPYELAMAELERDYKNAVLQLQRDEYQNIALPESIAKFSGYYQGRLSAPWISGTSELAGTFMNDERFGEFAGRRTLPGQELDLRDRLGTQQNVQNILNSDNEMELQTGVPYLGGRPMPSWLAPTKQWAKDYFATNQGRLPTPDDYHFAIQQGQVWTDEGGRVQPGGNVVYPPNHPLQGTPKNVFTGTNIMPATQGTGTGMVTEPGQQYTTQARVGGAIGPSPAGAATASAFGAGAPRSQAQRELEERGRATDIGAQVQREELALRETLGLAQLDIDRMRAEAEVAARNGETAIAASKEARADELERRAQALTEEVERRKLQLQTGQMTGFVDGNETLERIGLFGQDATGRNTLEAGIATGRVGNQATLERERLYGGAAYVNTGETLEQRTQRENAELERMRIGAGLRGPEDIVQYTRTLGGTPRGVSDIVDAAMGRYQVARHGDVAGAGPRPATVAGLQQDVRQGPSSAMQVEAGVRSMAAPEQFAWQNIDRLNPTTRKVAFALSEGQGRHVADIEAEREKVLGRYRGARAGRIAA